jgi:hypothetical protein
MANGGWPEITIARKGALALGLGSVPPSSLGARRNRAGQQEAQKYTMFY